MDELNKQFREDNNVKVESEHLERKKVEHKLEFSIHPRKGHSVWEINMKTKQVDRAKFKETDVIDFEEYRDKTSLTNIKDIVRKPGHVYISALNASSALKRYSQNKGHALIPKGSFKLN